MKKIIIAILLLNSMGQAKMFDIALFKKKIIGKNIEKLSQELITSPHVKNMALKNVILDKNSVDRVSSVALAIANKSKFGDKLMATTDSATAVIRQYAKYGENYLVTMKEFNQKSLALSSQNIKSLKDKFPSMPKISFKTSEAFNNKMVKTLQVTGKKGWETSQELAKLAKAHPKSTLVAGAYAWYVTDPKSFFEKKEELMAFIGSTLKEGVSDVTKLTLTAGSGIAEGFISTVKEKMTFSNTIVLILAIFSFILWKLRIYIKRYFKIKLENGLEKATRKVIKPKNTNNTEDSEGLL
jgi:hypothetical protein